MALPPDATPDRLAILAETVSELQIANTGLRDALPLSDASRIKAFYGPLTERVGEVLLDYGLGIDRFRPDQLAGLVDDYRIFTTADLRRELGDGLAVNGQVRGLIAETLKTLIEVRDAAASCGWDTGSLSPSLTSLDRVPELPSMLRALLERIVATERKADEAMAQAKLDGSPVQIAILIVNFRDLKLNASAAIGKIKSTVNLGVPIALDGLEKALSAVRSAANAMAGAARAISRAASSAGAAVAKAAIRAYAGFRTLVTAINIRLKSRSKSSQQGIFTRSGHSPDIPPLDFSLEQIRLMILRGDTPPHHWWPFITQLDFSYEKLSDLSPLSSLAELRHLGLNDARIADIAPLAALAKLQSLALGGTQVEDLTPLSTLAELNSLGLSYTPVSELKPLSTLISLQSLNLNHTRVSNLAPLSSLTKLRSLHLHAAQVSNLAPLAALSNLRKLTLPEHARASASKLAHITELEITYR